MDWYYKVLDEEEKKRLWASCPPPAQLPKGSNPNVLEEPSKICTEESQANHEPALGMAITGFRSIKTETFSSTTTIMCCLQVAVPFWGGCARLHK